MGRKVLNDKIRILHQDCDPTKEDDKSLPYNTYIVEYLQDGMTKFDITICDKLVDLFDYYWDNYRGDFIEMRQSQGRINPKLWGYEKKPDKKKK